MADDLAAGARGFLEGVPSPDRERAVNILAACPVLELVGCAPRAAMTVAGAELLLVAEGFVVLRSTVGQGRRSMVTCEAGVGNVLLAPSIEEELFALGTSRLLVIDAKARRRSLQIPALAERVVEQLAFTLGERQASSATFALTRHVERVRRKLLQLGRRYGHVGRDGIRIEFPISHALLAEMIGSSRETVTRSVDELQRDGFVARRGSTYHLLVSPGAVLDPAV
jgi:CRP/FNR family cyclic AMP-dependent transcriptional regulator